MNGLAFGLFALLPMAIGPLPSEGRVLVITLCTGGESRTVAVPVGDRDPIPEEPCPMKGCHAGCNRKRFDLSQ